MWFDWTGYKRWCNNKQCIKSLGSIQDMNQTFYLFLVIAYLFSWRGKYKIHTMERQQNHTDMWFISQQDKGTFFEIFFSERSAPSNQFKHLQISSKALKGQ